MRVQITTNLGTNDYPDLAFVMEGEERDVPDGIGVQLVKRRHAVELVDDSPRKAKKSAPEAIEQPVETKPSKQGS